MTDDSEDSRQLKTLPKWRSRIFHSYFLLSRPMTFGVRGIVYDPNVESVFLIRHTYVAGWHFPGGGVERGETAVQALRRELREEGNIEISAAPELKSLHLNRRASPRDHVALYLVTGFRQTTPRKPNFEIAESGFFKMNDLPAGTTPATLRRLDEVFHGKTPSDYW
ncbi:MAG TPA: NUDIX domain-containing protein [Rhizobiaceae bacterium]|nr:NUDIX domain-containing protein [Rhizobiaceae bacterium]